MNSVDREFDKFTLVASACGGPRPEGSRSWRTNLTPLKGIASSMSAALFREGTRSDGLYIEVT